MKKICYVATVPTVIRSFLGGYIRISSGKWAVQVVSSPGDVDFLAPLKAEFVPISIERKPSIWRDLNSMFALFRLFRREQFDLVHSIMPKAGLLCMMAAWLAGVPNRFHTFTGQVWATKRGWKRRFLKVFDKLIVAFSTSIFVDSPSQRDFLVAEGVLRQGQAVVLGDGSICGVDSHRFRPDISVRQAVRGDLGIDSGQVVILFMGRLTREKGVLDLAQAFAGITAACPDVLLMLVGAEEDVSFAEVQAICSKATDQLRYVPFTPCPESYMAAADIFCMPSYREGFGQAIIEAAAAGIPAVATRIYGISDAVQDGETGILVPVANVEALGAAMHRLVTDTRLRCDMGEKARERASASFSEDRILGELLDYYENKLQCQKSKKH